ncbi:MAG: T9SS type A sorting domain-containing protein [Sphingomonadales bacterium]|nr:T9SS type A sorting domain-containing protein [Sphingomonadales bacterium]
MRKICLILLLVSGALLSNIPAFSQRGCATHEHNQQLEISDPGFASRRQLIEQKTRQFTENPNRVAIAVTIPVVFHVVYNTTAQNISDAKILAQLEQLNLDFAKLNTDFGTVPSVFQPYGANTEVQFCMAQRDPNGLATTGINRVQTSVVSFSPTNNPVKFASSGGADAWPRDKYLNVWVCNLSNNLLGYAQFPGGAAATDGVVLLFSSVGSMLTPGTATPYHLGRTATHEVGHWLNLRHIWGDATCGNDLVDDTPVQNTANYGCPTFPFLSPGCTQSAPWQGANYQGDMFMNYMDYGNDNCLKMFSLGQKDRMQALFATGGSRAALLNSDGCTPPFGFGFVTPAAVVSNCPASSTLVATVGTEAFGGFSDAITLTSTTTAPTGTSISISPSPVAVGSSFTVTLNNANLLAPGTYNIVVSGSASGAPTRTVTVVFQVSAGAGPSVSTQPASQAVCAGVAASFTVASATASSYQWQSSVGGGAFSNIAGATSSTLTVSNTTVSMSGNLYRCVVAGQCGSTNSSQATLTVNATPAVVSQPADLTQCTGTSAAFSVTASGGSLTYQWQLSTDNGATFSNITGATAATYTIASTILSQNGNRFRCVVSGACTPSATSTAATLTLSAAPTITANPVATAVICERASTSFVVAATTPVGTLTYQWQASANGGTTWTNISGATNATYTQTNVPATQNGYLFRAAVTTSCGTIFSTNVALTVNTFPVISFSTVEELCLSDRPVALTATPAGGVFSGTGVAVGAFNPRTAGLGAKTVTYTASNAGCQSTLSRSIIVDQCAERQIPLPNPASLTLYPNPNTGKFGIRINTDLYTRLSIKVYNNLGQLIRKQEISNVFYGQVVNFDMSSLPAGTFHLLFVNDEVAPAVSRTISMVIYK